MPAVVIIYLLLLLLVSIVGLLRYYRLTAANKILAWSVIMVLICNVLNKVFSVMYHNNAPILHSESILEFIFYSTIYYFLFRSRIIKAFVLISIIAVTLFFCYNAIVLQPFGSVF